MHLSMKRLWTIALLAILPLPVSTHAAPPTAKESLEKLGASVSADADGVFSVGMYKSGPATTAAFRYVSQLGRVKAIYISETSVTSGTFLSLAGLTDMERFTVLNAPHFDDAAMGAFRNMKKLREVRMEGVAVKGPGMRHLRDNPSLEYLVYGVSKGMVIDGSGLENLKTCPKLERFSMIYVPTKGHALRRLEGMTQLRKFNWGPIDKDEIAETIERLAQFQKVEELGINATGLTDADLAPIAGMTQLTSLFVRQGKDLGDDFAKTAGKLKNLRVLGLSDTGVTDAGVAQLRDLDQLETLILSNTQVTDFAVQYLYKLPKLQSVGTSGTGISTDVYIQLQKEMKRRKDAAEKTKGKP